MLLNWQREMQPSERTEATVQIYLLEILNIKEVGGRVVRL